MVKSHRSVVVYLLILVCFRAYFRHRVKPNEAHLDTQAVRVAEVVISTEKNDAPGVYDVPVLPSMAHER